MGMIDTEEGMKAIAHLCEGEAFVEIKLPDLAEVLETNELRTQVLLDTLKREGMVDSRGAGWTLTRDGRALIVEQGWDEG